MEKCLLAEKRRLSVTVSHRFPPKPARLTPLTLAAGLFPEASLFPQRHSCGNPASGCLSEVTFAVGVHLALCGFS